MAGAAVSSPASSSRARPRAPVDADAEVWSCARPDRRSPPRRRLAPRQPAGGRAAVAVGDEVDVEPAALRVDRSHGVGAERVAPVLGQRAPALVPVARQVRRLVVDPEVGEAAVGQREEQLDALVEALGPEVLEVVQRKVTRVKCGLSRGPRRPSRGMAGRPASGAGCGSGRGGSRRSSGSGSEGMLGLGKATLTRDLSACRSAESSRRADRARMSSSGRPVRRPGEAFTDRRTKTMKYMMFVITDSNRTPKPMSPMSTSGWTSSTPPVSG